MNTELTSPQRQLTADRGAEHAKIPVPDKAESAKNVKQRTLKIKQRIRALQQERRVMIENLYCICALQQERGVLIANLYSEYNARIDPLFQELARLTLNAPTRRKSNELPRHLRAVASGRTKDWNCTDAVNRVLVNCKMNGILI